jgi:predicted DNA-binding protein
MTPDALAEILPAWPNAPAETGPPARSDYGIARLGLTAADEEPVDRAAAEPAEDDGMSWPFVEMRCSTPAQRWPIRSSRTLFAELAGDEAAAAAAASRPRPAPAPAGGSAAARSDGPDCRKTFKLPVDLACRLEEHARREGRYQYDVAREAIEAFLADSEPAEAIEPAEQDRSDTDSGDPAGRSLAEIVLATWRLLWRRLAGRGVLTPLGA